MCGKNSEFACTAIKGCALAHSRSGGQQPNTVRSLIALKDCWWSMFL
jgi:hypothetical protein